jgi:hypothetical protein
MFRPAGQQRPFGGSWQGGPTQPMQGQSAYTPSRSAGTRWNGSQWSTPSTNRSRAQPKASSGFGGGFNPAVGDGYDPSSRKQTLGGAFNDPRWAHNGGYWGDSRMSDPGQAQPIQQPNPGTPYDPSAGYGSGVATSRGFNPQPRTSFSGDPRGSFASQPADNRPPPFAMGPARTPWGQTTDPFGERMAMVEQMQNQNMMRQMAFNNGGRTPPPTWGMAPRLDPRRAIADAGLAGGSPTMWR